MRLWLFDIGGVVLHQPSGLRELIAQAHGLSREELDAIYMTEDWHLHKTGRISEDEYWRRTAQSLPSGFDGRVDELQREMGLAVVPDEEMIAFLRSGVRDGARIMAVSNAGSELHRSLVRFGLEDLFEKVYSSYDAGLAKPDPALLELVLAEAGVRAGDAVLVDDKERNTLAAEAMGLVAHVYRSFEDFRLAARELGWPVSVRRRQFSTP